MVRGPRRRARAGRGQLGSGRRREDRLAQEGLGPWVVLGGEGIKVVRSATGRARRARA